MAKANKPHPRITASAPEPKLAHYRAMRDFHVTPEPSGDHLEDADAHGGEALPFVIQKHAASRLHYDFRLSWKGVLKSWAVTKGPSYYPGDKRLAVQVEDHPLEYGKFEGVIPKGQYGGGTVMLWDQGTWEPYGDVDHSLKAGVLKFALHGKKMKGNWALVRMGGEAAIESKPNWLLIKEHDEFERGPSDRTVVDELPDSVASGRDMDSIALAADSLWNSKEGRSVRRVPEGKRGLKARQSSPRGSVKHKNEMRGSPEERAKAPREKLPSFIAPQLASLAKTPPRGDHWLHELKLDGYRIQARLQRLGKAPVQLLTRTGQDWTHRMKSIAEAVAALPVESALLDGELVVLSRDGTTSFAALQAAFQEGTESVLSYFIFDLLHQDGYNLRELPLLKRKQHLAALMARASEHESLRFVEHLSGRALNVFQKACELGVEGIISKLASSKYSSGRGGDWLKLKCYREQELVIGGFTLPSKGGHGVGALLLGYYRGSELIYAGRSGTGFTQATHKLLRERLEKLRCPTTPFIDLPQGVTRDANWVRPELVAKISFATWTADNLVRQAAFKGLREDKPAKEVRREDAEESMETVAHQGGIRSSAGHRMRSVAAKHVSAPSGEALSQIDLPVRLTHPDKIVDPESGLKKGELAGYYYAVSEFMLPHIADRPLMLVRCLDGSDKPCFHQKHTNPSLGGFFESVDVADKKTGKPEPYITVSNAQAMVELAQIGVLEIHVWGSRNESLDRPDRMVFDIDPDSAIGWKTIAATANEVRTRLRKLGVESFLKTTGGNGLHVVTPIRADQPWSVVKDFAHKLVLAMERDNPSLYLTRSTKADRVGKIYLDYLRNERGATSIAPFSPRARPGIPVALPLDWAELKLKTLPRFRVSEFVQWEKRLVSDPWESMPELKQRLPRMTA
jgi:bifunctional non-homologous end joining protein LigD